MLRAKEQIVIGSLVAGKVVEIFVEDNDFVKKNQLLARLDDGIGDSAVKKLKAALRKARSDLDYYEKFYARQKKLYEVKQISQDLFEQYTRNLEGYRAIVDQTKADLEIRRKEYENTFIRSPEDGVLIAKEISLGQMITSRLDATVLFVIAKNLKKMESHVNVDEADVGMVKEGQEAVFKVDAFPKLEFKSKVRQIRYLARIALGQSGASMMRSTSTLPIAVGPSPRVR